MHTRPSSSSLVFLLLQALLAVFLVGCKVTVTALQVPPRVGFGQTFEIRVQGTVSNGRIVGNMAGCVMQVPIGFRLKSWSLNSSKYIGLTLNDPALLALYKPEPGHVLYAFAARVRSNSYPRNPVLSAKFIAPTVPGLATIKVSGAGQEGSSRTWKISSPAGVNDFAKITAAPHVAKTLVVPYVPPETFVEDAAGLPTASSLNWGGIAFGDVDHDGRMDLGVSARLGSGPIVYLSRRSAQGTRWVYATGGLERNAGRSDVVFADFDGDGYLDVACSNGRVLLGDGKGGFRAGPTVPFAGEGIAAGDVDGDGRADVVIGGHLRDNVRFYFSRSSGWVESSTGLVNTGNSQGGGHRIMLEDVTGDGLLDIVWCRELLVGGTTVWQGDGKGRWSRLRQVFGTAKGPSTYWEIETGDVDGDGVAELVCGAWQANVGAAGGGVRIWKRTSPTTWRELTGTGLPQLAEVRDVAVADFDGDGFLDLAAGVTRGALYGIELYKGNGKGAFTPWANNGGLPRTGLGPPEGLDSADFDGDARPDLAVASYGKGVIAWRNTIFGFYRFGAPCGGRLAKAPRLDVTGSFKIGTNFSLGLRNVPGNGPAVLVAGTSHARIGGLPILPFDLGNFGAPGCTIYVAPDASLPLAISGGAGRVNLSIPSLTYLVDAFFFTQGLVSAPGANALGALASDAGSIKIGR